MKKDNKNMKSLNKQMHIYKLLKAIRIKNKKTKNSKDKFSKLR